MKNNQSEANAGATKPDGNLSAGQLIEGLAHEMPVESEQEETQPEDQGGETEESEEPDDIQGDVESEQEEETGEEEEQDFDIESLTPEQIQLIAKKGKSRLLQRFGELTAQKRALEEKLQTQAETKPSAPVIENNPFKELKSFDAVSSKMAECRKVVKDTDRILDDHEDSHGDDVIYTVGDKEYTKKEIKAANRNARDAVSEFLPAQQAELEKVERLKVEGEQWDSLIPQQIPELADEESELSKKFSTVQAEPSFQQHKAISPNFGFIVAHALRSIHQLSKKPKSPTGVPGVSAKAKVPSNPVGASAGPIGKGKKSDQLSKFEETGKQQDLVAALAANFTS